MNEGVLHSLEQNLAYHQRVADAADEPAVAGLPR
jgi:hypothetical protein